MARARDIANIINSGTFITPAQDQYPFRNLIINGAMQVAQRGTSTTGITGNGYFTADRWSLILFNTGSLGTWTQSVENDAPTGSGFRKSVKMLCTTADASPASDDQLYFRQIVEGQNLQSIRKGTANAQQLTLSFWVKANVTGTYIVELRDVDNNRSVSLSYSITSSATWEKKTIIVPADTTGVFDNDNARSLDVNWFLDVGSDSTSGTLQTSWGSFTVANRAVGQTNLAAATNNYWQITGVQLEVGAVATPFEFKPIDTELAQCQRYFFYCPEQIYINRGYNTEGYLNFSWPVTMRTDPTLTMNTSGFTSNQLSGAKTNIKGYIVSAWSTTPQITELKASAEL
jgi:hypothetical protein